MLSTPIRTVQACSKGFTVLRLAGINGTRSLHFNRLSASPTAHGLIRASPLAFSTPTFVQHRNASTQDVFGSSSAFSGLPEPPVPPPPMPSIQELAESGESVLEELGLISWWKPSSYFRIALEAMHMHFDIPWWTTIVSATIILRLATIYVPIMSQRLVARQSQYQPELEDFRNRINDARAEGNNLLMQQVLIEQRQFLLSKDIKIGRQFLVMMANGAVFMTQFFAIKHMVSKNYPGWSTGGTAWFTDLTACDPIYALPLISATTLAAVMRVGVETGASADQMAPAMKLVMQYGLPIFVLATSTQFSSAICLYWTTSNVVSLVYAMIFKMPAVRSFLNIPPIVRRPKKKEQSSAWKQAINQWQSQRRAAPSISSLRERDAELFKKAGRGKPVNK